MCDPLSLANTKHMNPLAPPSLTLPYHNAHPNTRYASGPLSTAEIRTEMQKGMQVVKDSKKIKNQKFKFKAVEFIANIKISEFPYVKIQKHSLVVH